MVDTTHEPAIGVMRVVAQRDAATLLPIISDEWRAYNSVGTLPTVNHSLHFKDPVTGVHIESYWNRVKTKLKRMTGCHRLIIV